MLWLRTKDDWTAVSLTWDDGGGAHVWTATSAVHSAYEALDELIAWLDATFAGESAEWEHVLDTLGGALFHVQTQTANQITAASAGAQSLLGSDVAHASGHSFLGVAAMSGTFAPSAGVAVRRWGTSPDFKGSAGGAGSIGHPTKQRRPLVSAVCSWREITRLAAVASNARHPREAYLYDLAALAWRRGVVTVGKIKRQREGGLLVRASFEVLA